MEEARIRIMHRDVMKRSRSIVSVCDCMVLWGGFQSKLVLRNAWSCGREISKQCGLMRLFDPLGKLKVQVRKRIKWIARGSRPIVNESNCFIFRGGGGDLEDCNFVGSGRVPSGILKGESDKDKGHVEFELSDTREKSCELYCFTIHVSKVTIVLVSINLNKDQRRVGGPKDLLRDLEQEISKWDISGSLFSLALAIVDIITVQKHSCLTR